MPRRLKTHKILDFFKLESAGGIVLIFAAVFAMFCANTPIKGIYNLLITTPVEIRIGPLEIAKPLLLWINDGLMAGFFFLVGLELKRELLEGELSDRSAIILPALGAIGGMMIPSLIYVAFNYDNPEHLRGWAIPAATDIAFALGILSLLGSRVPISLKILLTSLAIFDDIGAILVIALFYTEDIYIPGLIITAVCMVILYFINRKGIERTSIYIFLGSIMWVAMLKSGVHATLTGVILAMFIPMRSRENPDESPLMDLEHNLHGATAFIILPIFAFANSGVDLSNITMDVFPHPVPWGIALGLLIGKPIGIFGFLWLGVKLGLAKLPKNVDWHAILGMASLAGIGFTMSLFIGSLAFDQSSPAIVFDERIGIIIGSILSGSLGYFLLNKYLPREEAK